MTRPRTAASLAAALALAIATLLALGARSVHAQAAPFTAYGQGVTAGATVSALIEGKTCGTDTADAQGNWLIYISSTSPCAPSQGDEISFLLNGQPTGAVETWQPGGAPSDVANGISLVAGPDTTPPVVNAPTAITVNVAEGATGAAATNGKIAGFLAGATASDAVDGTVAVGHDAPAQFPLGTTTIAFTATDAAGNTGSATSTVTVRESGAAGTFLSPPTGSGINSSVWNGGTVDEVVEAAGPGLESVWIYVGGKATGYTVGAPAFVNRAFLALFPGGHVPSGEIMILIVA